MTEWALFFDGLCEPVNPGGVMAWGWSLEHNGRERHHGDGVRPKPSSEQERKKATNNVAEYFALGSGLRWLLDQKLLPNGEPVLACGDSQLIVNQMTGAWQCGAPHLVPLRDRCRQLVSELGVRVEYRWIPREQNGRADALSRAAYRTLTGQDPPERRKR